MTSERELVMTKHQVDAPFVAEMELSPDLTQVGAPKYGTCDNCGSTTVADGEDGCAGSADRPGPLSSTAGR